MISSRYVFIPVYVFWGGVGLCTPAKNLPTVYFSCLSVTAVRLAKRVQAENGLDMRRRGGGKAPRRT